MAGRKHGLRGSLGGVRTSLSAVQRFRRDLLRYWRHLLGALLCTIAYGAARLAEPWPLKYVFDNALGERPLETPVAWINRTLAGERTLILVVATATILVLAVLRSVFYYYQRVLTATAGQRVVMRVRERLFAHVQRQSLAFHARSSKGDMLTRLTGDIVALRDLLVATLVSLFSETAILVGFVVVMFLVEWRLALVAVLVTPVVFGLVTVYSARLRAATRKQRRREGELAGRLHEALSGIHVVQLFAREDEEDERLRSVNRRSLRSGLKATRLEARLNRAVELSVGVATAATIWVGATQVIAGRMTPGDLIVFIVYMQAFYRPLRRISRVTQRAAKASTSLERVTDVLDREPDVRDGPALAPRFRDRISFENVHFSYVPGIPVLRGVDLTVRQGETVALVGPTGAGKSTLLGLVPRLYDPTSGCVRLDGVDLRTLTLKSLRDQISVVPQSGTLFAGTFLDNIAYGNLDASRADVEAAARSALIHDFITSFPEGYGAVVGEGGVTLSGGEQQRLAIARALVRDAPIVLFDEPTTSLDAESEALVLAAIDALCADRTTLVIAHKLSTVRRADRIIVLEQGQIVEQGTHEQLLRSGRRYARLFELQLQPSGAAGLA
jgi:ATP-binding cassette, subfamily B, bacterial